MTAFLAGLSAWFASLFRTSGGQPKKKTIAGTVTAGVLAATAAFVGPWEGRELRAYQDVVGVWTICYGHTAGVQPGDTATAAECQDQFADDLGAYRKRLVACIPALPQQKEPVNVALISWAYNVGTGAACSSTLARKANAGDWRGACNELPRWNKAGGRVIRGLTRRRDAEQKLCLSGI